MKRCLEIILRILRPHVAWMFLLTLLSAAALIFTFTTNRESTIIGYVTFALSAYTTATLVVNAFDIVTKAHKLIDWRNPFVRIKLFLYSNKYSSRYMTDMPYRAKISLYFSLSMNLIYAAFKLIAGIHYASFWYGADALYYAILSAVRYILLRHVQKERQDLSKEYRRYRFCGYLLFALNAAFIGVVYQVVNQDMGYHYPGLMIYVVATYAFSSLAIAIVNLIRYRKFNSPVLSAIKAIGLTRALVAIFALQTAMLISFGGDDSEAFKNLMKILTGGGVCLLIFGMAAFMVAQANKNLKNLGINNFETKLKQNSNICEL